MKKITILLVWAALCLGFCANAQEVKTLKIGDKLPLAFWQQDHAVYQNGDTIKQNLAAYNGKLVILDFWATWCGTCVSKFPLVDSLQKENSDLKIILVNSTTVKEKPNAVKTFFASNPTGSKYPMPSIVADTILTKMFPFKVLPHLVWIDGTGMIIAMSTYHFFDRRTIGDLLLQHQRSLKKTKPKP